jgi:hypothetical protein
MFDPKDNGTKLIGERWIKIEGQENLNERIAEMQNKSALSKVQMIQHPNKP